MSRTGLYRLSSFRAALWMGGGADQTTIAPYSSSSFATSRLPRRAPLASSSTDPVAKRCMGVNVAGGRLHIAPPDIGHQRLSAPLIVAGPGGEAAT